MHAIICLLLATGVIASRKNEHRDSKNDVAVNSQLLLNELLLDYDPSSRPQGGRCDVQISIRPTFLAWKEDQLKISFLFEQMWRDERLTFVGKKEIKVADDIHIWLPDTVFSNSLDERRPHRGLIQIQPNGSITRLETVFLSIPCQLEPSQVWSSDGNVNCTLTLASRSYGPEDLGYSWSQKQSTIQTDAISRLNQLQKIDFTTQNIADSNSTADGIAILPKKELGVIFTVQTGFTKSVLQYLTKKAMKDL